MPQMLPCYTTSPTVFNKEHSKEALALIVINSNIRIQLRRKNIIQGKLEKKGSDYRREICLPAVQHPSANTCWHLSAIFLSTLSSGYPGHTPTCSEFSPNQFT